MNGQQLFDLLTDLQNDGLNLSEIHLAYPSQNPATVHERIEHTEIVQLPGSQVTEIVFMTDEDKKIYLELLNTEFAPVMLASPGEGAVIVEGVKDCSTCKHVDMADEDTCFDCIEYDNWEAKPLPESKLHLPSRGVDGHADKLVKELNELAKKKEPHNDSGKGFATYTPGDDKYYTHA
jgi:hypothetical protein